ncbi:MAG: hypothetical protein GY862_17620, partial [Gammaproteobacteria bacterium]|nr:hypothetical protein [Gammaproteobacteria bacterium]
MQYHEVNRPDKILQFYAGMNISGSVTDFGLTAPARMTVFPHGERFDPDPRAAGAKLRIAAATIRRRLGAKPGMSGTCGKRQNLKQRPKAPPCAGPPVFASEKSSIGRLVSHKFFNKGGWHLRRYLH